MTFVLPATFLAGELPLLACWHLVAHGGVGPARGAVVARLGAGERRMRRVGDPRHGLIPHHVCLTFNDQDGCRLHTHTHIKVSGESHERK